MKTIWLSQNICDTIEHMTHNFIWKGTNTICIHLVCWKKIMCLWKLGDLWIQSTRDANTSLLSKLVWGMLQNTNKLRVCLLSEKHLSGVLFTLPFSYYKFLRLEFYRQSEECAKRWYWMKTWIRLLFFFGIANGLLLVPWLLLLSMFTSMTLIY